MKTQTKYRIILQITSKNTEEVYTIDSEKMLPSTSYSVMCMFINTSCMTNVNDG